MRWGRQGPLSPAGRRTLKIIFFWTWAKGCIMERPTDFPWQICTKKRKAGGPQSPLRWSRLNCLWILRMADSMDFSGSMMLYSPQKSGSDKPRASSLRIMDFLVLSRLLGSSPLGLGSQSVTAMSADMLYTELNRLSAQCTLKAMLTLLYPKYHFPSLPL